MVQTLEDEDNFPLISSTRVVNVNTQEAGQEEKSIDFVPLRFLEPRSYGTASEDVGAIWAKKGASSTSLRSSKECQVERRIVGRSQHPLNSQITSHICFKCALVHTTWADCSIFLLPIRRRHVSSTSTSHVRDMIFFGKYKAVISYKMFRSDLVSDDRLVGA